MRSKFLCLLLLLSVIVILFGILQSLNSWMHQPQPLVCGNTDDNLDRLNDLYDSTPDDLTDLRSLQNKELELNKIYRIGWKMAKLKYWKIVKQLRLKYPMSKEIFNVPKDFHLALISYTLNYPKLYDDFNNRTKRLLGSEISLDEYNYKSLFKLLELARRELSGVLKPIKPDFPINDQFIPEPTKLYRGLRNKVVLMEEQCITFQHYVSTTIYKELAVEDFAKGNIVLEFEGGISTNLGMYLGSHSEYPEEEVLLFPMQMFRVESVSLRNGFIWFYVLKKIESNEYFLGIQIRIFLGLQKSACDIILVFFVLSVIVRAIVEKRNMIHMKYKRKLSFTKMNEQFTIRNNMGRWPV